MFISDEDGPGPTAEPTEFTAERQRCYARGVEHYQAGEYAAALSEFNLAEGPVTGFSPDLALRKALCLKELDQAVAAQELLRQTAGDHPAFTDLIFWQAEIFAAAGDLEAAEASYRRCLALGDAPSAYNGLNGVGAFRAWQGLAAVFLAQGRDGEAVEAAREALKSNPRLEEGLSVLAQAWQRAHGGGVAAAELERLIRPQDDLGFLLLAEVLLGIGEYRLARQYCAKINPAADSADQARYLEGFCLLRQGDYHGAEITLEQIEPGSEHHRKAQELLTQLVPGDAPKKAPIPGDYVAGLTSVIILTYNQLSYTQLCLETLKHHTPEPHEIVVVDNGSTDGTVEYLKSRPGLRVILNPENFGFAKGVNQGLQAARGEFLLLLNNDTILTPGWLRNLQGCLNSLPRVGLVGPRTNYAGSRQVMAASYQTPEELLRFTSTFNREDPRRWFEVDKLVGFCLLLNREVLADIGGFDERFGLGNYEDDDYCRRAQAAGYRLLVAGDTFVHHFGSISFTGNGIDYESLLTANRQRYTDKWGLASTAEPAEATREFRITYLMDRFTDGAEAHWQSIRQLRNKGHQVVVVAAEELPGVSNETIRWAGEENLIESIPESDLLIATSWSTAAKAYVSGQGIPIHWCELNLAQTLDGNSELRPQVETACRLSTIKVAFSEESRQLIANRFYQDCHLIEPDAPAEAVTELFSQLRARHWPGFQLGRGRFVPNQVNSVAEVLHRQRYQKASEYVSGKRVLDAGCGVGYGTQILARAGAELAVGVDLGPEALDYARLHYPAVKAEYRQMDLTSLQWDDGTFDVAVAFGVLERSQAGRILSELRRVVRPGGLVLISTPNRDNPAAENLGPAPRGTDWGLTELKSFLEGFLTIEFLLGQRVVPNQVRLEEADDSQAVEFLAMGRVHKG